MLDPAPKFQTPIKFSVCLPSYNVAHLIEDTLLSILSQSVLQFAGITIQIIIADGASTDETLTVINRVAQANQQQNVDIVVISESDNNAHEAMWKAITQGNGTIFAFIGAGDMYAPRAFEIVAEIMTSKERLWVTGYHVMLSKQGYVTSMLLPFLFSRRLIQRGLYNRFKPAYIQAEGTFWHHSLNREIEPDIFQSFQYAGDYYLWLRFSQVASLTIIASYLAGFRMHSGQNSENMKTYQDEVKQMSMKSNIFDQLTLFLQRILWYAPTRVKKRLNPNTLLIYSHTLEKWV